MRFLNSYRGLFFRWKKQTKIYYWSNMPSSPSSTEMERKFNAAVNVIRGLPKNGKWFCGCFWFDSLFISQVIKHRYLDLFESIYKPLFRMLPMTFVYRAVVMTYGNIEIQSMLVYWLGQAFNMTKMFTLRVESYLFDRPGATKVKWFTLSTKKLDIRLSL